MFRVCLRKKLTNTAFASSPFFRFSFFVPSR